MVSNFVVQALQGKPLTVYGDGSQTRSFLFVSDLIDGMVRLMNYEGDDAHEPVNVGSPHETTMLNLVQTLGKVIGRDLEIIHKPLPPDDPVRRCAVTDRARQRLGWKPTVSLEEGLSKTVAFFRQILDSPTKDQ